MASYLRPTMITTVSKDRVLSCCMVVAKHGLVTKSRKLASELGKSNDNARRPLSFADIKNKFS